jgi:hypothetical protein
VGTDAVWTQTPEDERLWRVPLRGGPASGTGWPRTPAREAHRSARPLHSPEGA